MKEKQRSFAGGIALAAMAGALLLFSLLVSLPLAALGESGASLGIEGVRAGDRVDIYQVVRLNAAGGYEFAGDYGVDMDGYLAAGGDNERLREYVDRISAAVHASGRTPDATADAGGSRVSFEGLEPGQYLVSVVPSSAGCGVVYQNVTANAGDTAVLKSQPITITKTVDGAHETDAYSVGQKVPFVLSTFVPSYPADATHEVFRIEDASSPGLAFGPDDIVVRCGSLVLQQGRHYAYREQDADGATLHVLDFSYEEMRGFAGAALTVEIQATLTDAAVPASPELNTATVFFRNNPYVQADDDHASDQARVRVYGIRLSKVAEATGEPLAGARFDVLVLDDSGDADIALETGSAKARAVASMESDGGGTASVRGLSKGTYYIRESQAPEGYLPINGVLEVPVAADAVAATGEWAGYVDAGTVKDRADTPKEPGNPGDSTSYNPSGSSGASGKGLSKTGDDLRDAAIAAAVAVLALVVVAVLWKRRKP